MKVRSLANYTYVLEDERDLPTEDQTIWKLRPLTAFEDRNLLSMAEGNTPVGETIYAALFAGLIGYERLQGTDGENLEEKLQSRTPLGVKVKGVADAILDTIPSAYRHELANVVIEHGKLSEDDAKN